VDFKNLKGYHFFKNLLLAVAWIIFVYIWGIWNWKETELFKMTWWFDTAGHAVFGALGSLTLLYFYMPYSAELVIAKITKWGIYWEAGELFYDYFIQPNFAGWLAQAQKGSADNIIDILTTYFSARLAMFVYKHFYQKKEIEEEIDEIAERIEKISKIILIRRRKQLKELPPKMKSAIKKLFRAVRDSNSNKSR